MPCVGLDPYNARLGSLGLLLLRTEVRIKAILTKEDWFCLVGFTVVSDSYWVSSVGLNYLVTRNFHIFASKNRQNVISQKTPRLVQ